MDENARRIAERDWHDKRFSIEQPRIVPPEILARYLRSNAPCLFPLEKMYRLAMESARGKRVLIVGCGTASAAVLLAMSGAHVMATDISPTSIRFQQEQATLNGVAANIDTRVVAAEQLPFGEGSFDIVFGVAILHHLPDALGQLARCIHGVLTPDGVALFSEPVSFSPTLAALRKMVPVHTELSPGERQLTRSDLRHFENLFSVTLHPFHMLARLNRFVLDGPLEFTSRTRRGVAIALAKVDRTLLKGPLQRFAGIVVMECRKELSK